MLDVSITEENNRREEIVFVNLKGGLDSEHAIDFYDFIFEEIGKGYRKFIIDCTNLDFISSSGISIVLRLRNKLSEKKCILIYSTLNEEISTLFHFFGLDKNLYLAKTNEEAIKLAEGSYYEEERPSLASVTAASVSAMTEPLTGDEIPTVTDYSSSKTYEAMEVTDPNAGGNILDDSIDEDIVKNRIHFTEDENPDRLTEELVAIPDEEVEEEEPELPLEEARDEVQSELTEVKVSPLNEVEKIYSELKPESESYKREELKITVPFFIKNDTGSSSAILDSITDFEPEMPSVQNASPEKFTMLIVNCSQCGSKIRISKQGKQMCPSCHYKFNLRQSGSISTIEKIDY